ncbi:Hyalin [Holothuria leucospilota]|uniref:Hyalin n=1 Tax=Holothuria leucospilota TaxID=206669 RepID=A0A9Q0YFT6_HOLLE|nr:Hyalin [Holothuria leucospilota]
MGESTQSVTWTEPTVDTSNGQPNANITRNRIPGSEFVIGSTYVLYNFTSVQDPRIQTECAFYIIVSRFQDTQAPVVTCPRNMVVVGDLNSPTTTVTWDPEPPTDNVGVSSFSFFPPSGSSFGIGITSVLFTATDTSGNKADCSFSVTVVENTDTNGPIFRNCPADFNVLVPNDRSFAIVNWSPPTVFDESSTTVTSSHTPPVQLAVGQSHTVVYTAEDAASLTANCTFIISVGYDLDPPVMDCGAFSPITRYVREAERNTPISISWNEPSPLATDNSGQVSVVRTNAPGSLFLPGIIETVRYTATDGAGLTDDCSFMVSVVVDPAPRFQNCTDYRHATDMDSNTASFILLNPLATDVDPENPSAGPVVNAPTNIPTQFPIGTTTLRWTATDSRGSVTECVINVIVSDGQAPDILSCPGNFEVFVENSTFRSALVTWPEPQIQENSGQTVDLRSTISPGSLLGPGNYTVRYTARDGFNNEASCSFHVTVRDLPGDTTRPELQGCPTNIFAVALQDLDYNDQITWVPPTATDNEDTNVDLIASHNPLQRFFIGETTVTYTAIDDRNNRQACSFQVIVQDDQDPVFSECPDNVFQYVNPDTVTTLIKLDDVLVTDNSGSVQRDQNFQSREVVDNSPVTINLVASDPSGNQASCLVVVTIERTTGNGLQLIISCLGSQPNLWKVWCS